MRRALFWLLAAFLVWEGWVYLYSRPRFWARIALVSEQVSHGARHLYNHTKQEQAARQTIANHAVKQSAEPLPDSNHVVDAVRYFLEQRRRGA